MGKKKTKKNERTRGGKRRFRETDFITHLLRMAAGPNKGVVRGGFLWGRPDRGRLKGYFDSRFRVQSVAGKGIPVVKGVGGGGGGGGGHASFGDQNPARKGGKGKGPKILPQGRPPAPYD